MPSVGFALAATNPTVQSAAYTAKAGDLVLANAVAASFTVTLPAASAGVQIAVKKTDISTNAVTVIGTSNATIDGDTSCTIAGTGTVVQFVSDGTNWRVQGTANLNVGTDSMQMLTVPNYQPGYWYDRRTPLPFGPPGQAGSGSPYTAASTLVYVPQFCHRSLIIDTLAVMTLSASPPTSGATVRIGLYAATGSSYVPGARLYDWGIMTLTAAGGVTCTMSAAGTLPKGWSWWGLSFNATAPNGLQGLSGLAIPTPPMSPSGNTVPSTAVNSYGAAISGYSESTAFTVGALVATASPTAMPAPNIQPNIWYRVVA